MTDYIYFVQRESDNLIKIGYAGNPDVRIRALASEWKCPMTYLGLLKGGLKAEQAIHKIFKKSRVSGEWFEPVPDLLHFISLYALPKTEFKKSIAKDRINDFPDFLTTTQVGGLLNISPIKVQEIIENEDLPVVQILGIDHIHKSDLKEFLDLDD